ncbi:MAG: hypothetical protein Q9221_006309 [Calogaya cf. arnoldii]
MPQFGLDHTLREFCCQDEDEDPKAVIVNALPITESQMTRGIPSSIKFAYQSPSVFTKDPDRLATLLAICPSSVRQKELQGKYGQMIELPSQHMHSKAYYGSACADAITDYEGMQWVIDLNVRVIGAQPLGFLKTNFSVERGLQVAAVCLLDLKCDRQTFGSSFKKQFHNGVFDRLRLVPSQKRKDEYRNYDFGSEA